MTITLLDRCMRYIGTSIAYSPNDSDEKFALLEALRNEIAKPEQAPAWHDAPTCEGWWMNSVSYCRTFISENSGRLNVNTGIRWYGPIPEDKT